MHRDRQVKRARLLKAGADRAAVEAAVAGSAAGPSSLPFKDGHKTGSAAAAPARVSFGGPGESNATPAQGIKGEREPVPPGGRQGQEEQGGEREDYEEKEKEDGGGRRGQEDGERKSIPGEPRKTVVVGGATSQAIGGGAPVESETAGCEGPDTGQAFLTGVPTPHVHNAPEELENPPETPMYISATLAKLQAPRRPSSPSSAAPSPSPDKRFAGDRRDGGREANDIAAFRAGVMSPQPRRGGGGAPVSSSVGQPPVDSCWAGFSAGQGLSPPRSEEADQGDSQQLAVFFSSSYGVTPDEHSAGGLSASSAAQAWANASDCSGSRWGAADGASAGGDHRQGWHPASYSSAAVGAAAAADSCASSLPVLGLEGLAAVGGKGKRLWGVGTSTVEGENVVANKGDSKNDGLLHSLRHFVASHVDPHEVRKDVTLLDCTSVVESSLGRWPRTRYPER